MTRLLTVIIEREGDGYVSLCPVLMQKAVAGITVTIPAPDHKEPRVGALMSIIRQSGLPRALYE